MLSYSPMFADVQKLLDQLLGPGYAFQKSEETGELELARTSRASGCESSSSSATISSHGTPPSAASAASSSAPPSTLVNRPSTLGSRRG